MLRLVIALAMAWTFALTAKDVSAAKRVALVIGNSTYKYTPTLVNPTNDASAISVALKRLGFEVISESNLTKLGMDDTFRRFARAMRDAEAALFYYAGHGMQYRGVNYLMPVDAKLEDEADLPYEMALVDNVLADMGRVKGVRIAVLDACRNNPLELALKAKLARTRSISPTRGFARISRTEGQLIAFATQAGTVAADGVGRNSPFTAALLKHIETPGLEAGLLFRRVASAVHEATGGRQLPELSVSLLGEFYFAGRGAPKRPEKPSSNASKPLTHVSPAAEAWREVKDSQRVSDLEAFVTRFPNSFFSVLARSRLKKLTGQSKAPDKPISPEAWEAYASAKTAGEFEAIIKRFPNSIYADLAKSRLKKLGEHKVAVGVFPQKPKPAVGQNWESGREFQDCRDCPKMVVVPPGSFTMGSPESEKDRDNSEGPQRRVTIPQAFAVGKFEVTVDQFAAFVEDSRHDAGQRCHVLHRQHGWQQDGGRNFQNPGFSQTGSHPAACVNWDDAKAYVAWISRNTGKSYRLLSEAEWEYAARSGSMTRFHFGDRDKDLCSYANVADRSSSFDWKNKSCSDGVGDKTARVGRYKANSFGLHDLYGNVWEWVEDCWNADYANATKGNAPRTSGDCSSRVLRGGAWANLKGSARSASRNRSITYFRYSSHGFRIGRTLIP